jgi:hypothetical protein
MKRLAVIAMILGLVFIHPGDAPAKRGWSSGGWGPGSTYSQLYNPQTIETVSGEVVSVGHAAPMKGMSQGVVIVFKTSKETLNVHLGPSWFIEKQDFRIEPKDKLEINGSRVELAGKPVLIAAEVKKGDQYLNLRDESGFPIWAAWRKR